MNIALLRNKLIKDNPLIADYKIANDLMVFAIYKSYFRDNLFLSGDARSYLDKNYPKDLMFFTFVVSKYKLNEDTIKEIINALNLSNKEIKISVNRIIKKDDEEYIVTLSFLDKFDNCISLVNYKFITNYIAKGGLRYLKWITLPYLKEKVYVGFEVKELEYARLLTTLLYKNNFFLNYDDVLRINYLSNTHIFNNLLEKSFMLEIRHNSYNKDTYFSDLLDTLKLKEIDSLLFTENITKHIDILLK